MELIGHLPTEEATACKILQACEMWFQHVSTCFMFQNLCLTLLSLIHFNLSFYVDATQCPFDAVGMLLGARLLDPSSLSRKTV
jgi:hypothetical protein